MYGQGINVNPTLIWRAVDLSSKPWEPPLNQSSGCVPRNSTDNSLLELPTGLMKCAVVGISPASDFLAGKLHRRKPLKVRSRPAPG